MQGLFQQSLLDKIVNGESPMPECDFRVVNLPEPTNECFIYYKDTIIAEIVQDLIHGLGSALSLHYSDNNDVHKLFCETFSIKPFSYYINNLNNEPLNICKDSVEAYCVNNMYADHDIIDYSPSDELLMLVRGKFRIFIPLLANSEVPYKFKYCVVYHPKINDDPDFTTPEILVVVNYNIDTVVNSTNVKECIGERTKLIILLLHNKSHIYKVNINGNINTDDYEVCGNWKLFVADYYSLSKKRSLKTKSARI